MIHHYIRKCGHFIEYFIFSLLILRAIRGGRRDTAAGMGAGGHRDRGRLRVAR